MNIQELFDATVSITNKPELVNETYLALQRATLVAHGLEFWKRDMVIQQLTLPSSANVFQVGLDNFPRYRAFEFFRRWDDAGANPFTSALTGAAFEKYDEIDAEDMFIPGYLIEKDFVYYMAGDTLNFRGTIATTKLLAAHYRFPPVHPIVGYNSWIANEFPSPIYNLAASSIARMIGNDDIAKKMEQDLLVDYQVLRQNFLYARAK